MKGEANHGDASRIAPSSRGSILNQGFHLMSNSRTNPPGSIGGVTVANSIKQGVPAALCALFLSFFLVSCGPVDSSPNAPSSPTTTGKPVASISVPAPPGSANRPLEPGQTGTQYMPNGLPAFSPARGINADMLFAEKITDTDDRFRRLENAVTDMRREFDSVMPAIVRLSAVEQDMQELIGQLQTLTQQQSSSPDMALDPAPIAPVTEDALPPRPFPDAPSGSTPNATPAAPTALPQALTPAAAPPPAAPAPAASPPTKGQISIHNIRTGQQPGGITRIVLDASASTPHHSDLDNDELLLLIEMPEAAWSAAPQGMFANAPLLTSWATEPLKDGKGVRLILHLKNKVSIAKDSALSNPDRIVLDLKKAP